MDLVLVVQVGTLPAARCKIAKMPRSAASGCLAWGEGRKFSVCFVKDSESFQVEIASLGKDVVDGTEGLDFLQPFHGQSSRTRCCHWFCGQHRVDYVEGGSGW